MLNGTHSPSLISFSVPPLNLVFCSPRKENFTKEVSRELQECFCRGSSTAFPTSLFSSLLCPQTPLFFYSFFSHFIFSVLCLTNTHCPSLSVSLIKHFSLCCVPLLSLLYYSLFLFIFFVIYEAERRNCNLDI